MNEQSRPQPVNAVRDASRKMVRELGLLGSLYGRILPSNTQCHVLIELAHRKMLPSELARVLRIDRSTLSRVAAVMEQRGWIKSDRCAKDGRGKEFCLTIKGKEKLKEVNEFASERVGGALAQLTEKQQELAVMGLGLYADALRRARLSKAIKFRKIRKSDDPVVAAIIRKVMPEFGAGGPGFAINDPEVDWMSKAFSKPNTVYFVIEIDGEVLGGGGIAPLKGGDTKTCELQKMYFLPDLRGLGAGRMLLEKLFGEAKRLGYKRCYLETLHGMKAANHLYQSFGFKDLRTQLGATGHCSCDRWMVKEL